MLPLSILAATCSTFSGGGADLYGVEADGRVVLIDHRSGALTPVGHVGIPIVDASTGMACHILALTPDGRILSIDARSGRLAHVVPMTGLPPGAQPMAIGLDLGFFHLRAQRVFVIVSEPLAGDVLYTADLARGVYTVVGTMGQRGLRGLGSEWAVTAERDLFLVNLLTGEPTPMPSTGPPHSGRFEDIASGDGNPYAVNEGLWQIAGIGPKGELLWDQVSTRGLEGVRGLALVDPIAYADCDTSTGPYRLDIFDFLTFQRRHDAADPYACDCDTAAGFGVCDVFDWLCYLNVFVGQCR